MPLAFVLGGARSGKSRHAEILVRQSGPGPWTYIATAEAYDDEMAARIAKHRADRGDGWVTLDAPHDLAGTLRTAGEAGRPVLLDCLTLWLSNRLLADADLGPEMDRLVAALSSLTVPAVVVSNEVGMGIVPDNRLARQFRDAQGILNQKVAAAASEAWFVIAGLPMRLK